MISSKKPLVTLESLMEIPKGNMDISQTFFHHSYVDICGSGIRVRRATGQMQKVQCTVHISEKIQEFYLQPEVMRNSVIILNYLSSSLSRKDKESI